MVVVRLPMLSFFHSFFYLFYFNSLLQNIGSLISETNDNVIDGAFVFRIIQTILGLTCGSDTLHLSPFLYLVFSYPLFKQTEYFSSMNTQNVTTSYANKSSS